METLGSIGIKLFVLAALKKIYLYLSSLLCVFTRCSASVNALQIAISSGSFESTTKWETFHIFKDVRFFLRV
jgi:hypothetical protein